MLSSNVDWQGLVKLEIDEAKDKLQDKCNLMIGATTSQVAIDLLFIQHYKAQISSCCLHALHWLTS